MQFNDMAIAVLYNTGMRGHHDGYERWQQI